MEVLSFTPVTIPGLYEAAKRAHYYTSFDPEKRAEQYTKEYTDELNEDLQQMREAERDRYYQNYVKYLFAWLGARSNCVSVMITGPSNFDVRRHQKANRSEHKRWEEFRTWRSKALKAIERKKRMNRTPEEVDNERFEQIKANITSLAKTIIEIDEGTNSYSSRALFVSAITRSIETLVNNGWVNLYLRALDLIRELNTKGPKPIVTDRNKIWNLLEVAEKVKANKEELEKENKEIEFDGFKVIYNYQIDRLQIVFPAIPSAEIRQQLKQNAFKWSPREQAWQRQLTNNAVYTTEQLLKIHLPSIS